LGGAEKRRPPGGAVPARAIWESAREALYPGPMENFGPDDGVRCARCRNSFPIGDAYVLPEDPSSPRSWYCQTPECTGDLGDFVPLG
jgi:hypothetical protein